METFKALFYVCSFMVIGALAASQGQKNIKPEPAKERTAILQNIGL